MSADDDFQCAADFDPPFRASLAIGHTEDDKVVFDVVATVDLTEGEEDGLW